MWVDAARAAITLQETFDKDGKATGPALYVAKANYAAAGVRIQLFDVKLSNGKPVAFAALDNSDNGGRGGGGALNEERKSTARPGPRYGRRVGL